MQSIANDKFSFIHSVCICVFSSTLGQCSMWNVALKLYILFSLYSLLNLQVVSEVREAYFSSSIVFRRLFNCSGAVFTFASCSTHLPDFALFVDCVRIEYTKKRTVEQFFLFFSILSILLFCPQRQSILIRTSAEVAAVVHFQKEKKTYTQTHTHLNLLWNLSS